MAKKAITMTLTESIIKKGKESADSENRSFTNYVEWLILQDYKKRTNK